MFRIRAKQEFKHRYLQYLLAGDTSEDASDHAMEDTKKKMLAWLAADKSFSDARKQRLYAIAFEELVDWQLLLVDLPQIKCEPCRKELRELLKKMETPDNINNPSLDGDA